MTPFCPVNTNKPIVIKTMLVANSQNQNFLATCIMGRDGEVKGQDVILPQLSKSYTAWKHFIYRHFEIKSNKKIFTLLESAKKTVQTYIYPSRGYGCFLDWWLGSLTFLVLIGRPFVKRFALCYRTVVCLSVLSCL